MAINLNPGADASVVTAATRAGLASAPGDYSKQFQSIADSYAETMQSNTEMWKTITDTTLALSANSIEKAGERRRANIDIRNTPGGEALEGQIKGYKNRLMETWGLSKKVEIEDQATYDAAMDELGMEGVEDVNLPSYEDWAAGEQKKKRVGNNPLSRENRDKRAQIFKERDVFYGEVTQMGAGLKVINTIQANGEFDAKATGAHGIELAEAFAASQTTGEHTKNGNYFESSWDPKKKKIIHTLMNDGKGEGGISKGPVKDEDGELRTYTTEQIQGVLIPKDANLEPAYTKIFNGAEKNGQSLGTEWDEYQSNKAKKAIEGLVETSGGLHRSIHATFGHLDKSFQEEFTSISELSAKEYTKLASVLPSDEKGNLMKTGVLREVDGMSDGKPGIQQSDFASTENQNKVSLAMFDKGYKHYNEQNLKDTFIEWVAGIDGKLARAHNHGMSYNAKVLASKNKKAPVPGSETGKSDKFGGWGTYNRNTQGDGEGGQSKPWTVIDSNRKSLLAFENFGGVHYEYKYEGKEGKKQWKAYDQGEFKKDLTMKQIAKIEGMLKPSENDWSIFSEKRVQEKTENVEANTASVPGGFTLASLQTNSLSEITRSLQNTFDADFKENYNIENVMEMDSAGLNPGLKPVGNKIKITSKDGTFSKEYDIGPNATQEIAAQINIDFADNLLQTQEPE